MVNRFSKFRLREEEDDGVILDQTDVRVSREECEKSIVGKLWGVKTANYSGIRNVFSQLWCQRGELKVVELDLNLFQFIFSNSEERDRSMMKRSWFFKN